MVHVPAPLMLTLVPFVPPVEQTLGVELVKVTTSATPDVVVPVAVPLTVNAALPYVCAATPDVVNEIVCDALETVKDLSTSRAARYRLSPTCDARMVHVPSPSIVTVVPLVPDVLHTPVVWLAKLTLSPEALVVPDTVKDVRL